MPRSKPNLLVVGSLNLDYIATVNRLPRPGETLAATGFLQRFGGKGANQAVAAARQGARVTLIGCVGDDSAGRAYRRRLRNEEIEVRGLTVAPGLSTGTALIAVDDRGENMILVAAGANGRLRPESISKARSSFSRADILLLQFETPMPTVIEAVRQAARSGLPVVLNPSPYRTGFAWGKYPLEALVVNETEAELIFGQKLKLLSRQLSQWQRAMRGMRVSNLVVTRGAAATLWVSPAGIEQVRPIPVKPVDTVGAGDAFAGTMATCRAAGMDWLETLRRANCAGALATLKRGAQESMPTGVETERAVARMRNRKSGSD